MAYGIGTVVRRAVSCRAVPSRASSPHTPLSPSLADNGAIQPDLRLFSQPLSEIDYTQCTKVTVSYRTLPEDYPLPPCSQRSELDQSVLNDNLVSVPTGSEEQASFKHMRKNTYEESLFRCEVGGWVGG